jgi:hypothetical protein
MHSNKNKEIVLVYENDNITLNKTDDFNYFVRTKNGTYGFITCSDNRDELIVVVKKNKYEILGRFVHYKEDPIQDIEDFIIEQTINNILYLVSKTHLHSIHKDFSPFMNDVTAETYDHIIKDKANSLEFNGSPLYKVINEDHNYYAKNCVYYYVLFTKKKVIDNVFRYTQIFKNEDMKTLKKIHFYKAGDITLSFGLFNDFLDSKKHTAVSVGKGNRTIENFYGVDGCLTNKVNSILSWCDISDVKVLKYKKYYVNVAFENGKHKLVYMENLNRDEYQRKKYNFLQPTINQNTYIQEAYLTVTASIESNKVYRISSFDIDEIKKFDDSLVSRVFIKQKKLALIYPSHQLKNTALNLGFNVEELNLDILDTIDMYTY